MVAVLEQGAAMPEGDLDMRGRIRMSETAPAPPADAREFS